MGRGRAKAKQTKVARQLKYQTFDTDFDALQRELGSPSDRNDEDDSDDADDVHDAYEYEYDDDEPRRRAI